jgi:probable F420-dependent oxidoreductase
VLREERAARFDEMLPLVRRIWAEESVDHTGEFFSYEGLRVEPKPTKPLDVWLGGKAKSELRRVGRLGDGWLASFTTPSICAASRVVIDATAADANRAIDPEHFGAIVAYSHDPLPDSMLAMLAARSRETDPNELVAVGHDGLRRRCEDYVAVGFSKLVPVCLSPVTDWPAELEAVAKATLDLQT